MGMVGRKRLRKMRPLTDQTDRDGNSGQEGGKSAVFCLGVGSGNKLITLEVVAGPMVTRWDLNPTLGGGGRRRRLQDWMLQISPLP